MSQEPTPNVEFVEIYASHNIADAQILEQLFHDHEIPLMTRTIQVSGIPLSVGKNGEHRIGVDATRVAQALDLIQQALVDGAINQEDAEILVMTTM